MYLDKIRQVSAWSYKDDSAMIQILFSLHMSLFIPYNYIKREKLAHNPLFPPPPAPTFQHSAAVVGLSSLPPDFSLL